MSVFQEINDSGHFPHEIALLIACFDHGTDLDDIMFTLPPDPPSYPFGYNYGDTLQSLLRQVPYTRKQVDMYCTGRYEGAIVQKRTFKSGFILLEMSRQSNLQLLQQEQQFKQARLKRMRDQNFHELKRKCRKRIAK